MRLVPLLLVIVTLLTISNGNVNPQDVSLTSKFILPEGYAIEVYAEGFLAPYALITDKYDNLYVQE